MKVFISWSGPRSHQVALALRSWLPAILPHVAPWVSSEDIAKGARWTIALGSELGSTSFGIICLVPENLGEPWVVFEAGACYSVVALAGPLAADLDVSVFDPTQRPLAHDRDHSTNDASDAPIDPGRVDQAFEREWPGLAGLAQGTEREKVRPRRALVREVVVPLAAPHEDLFKEPGGLPKKQVAILTALAKNPDAHPTANLMARAIGEDRTKTEYHLDRLRERRLINQRLVIGQPPTYDLTEAGRAYVVENGLI